MSIERVYSNVAKQLSRLSMQKILFSISISIILVFIGIFFSDSGLREYILSPSQHITLQHFRRLSVEEQRYMFEQFVAEHGGIAGREFLLKAYPDQPSYLHDRGHIIGEAFYREYRDEALGLCDSTFSFSCYHGAMVGFIREHGFNKEEVERFAYRGCKRKQTMADFHGCYHGLGHAIMVINANDLPTSMRDCDRIVRDDRLLFDCYQGVAMENAQSSFTRTEQKSYLDEHDPYYPCNSIDEKYAAACYSEHVVSALRILRHDWQKLAQYCASLPTGGEFAKNMCFSVLGVTADAAFPGDIEKVSKICNFQKEYIALCLIAFARQRAYAGDYKKAQTACELLLQEDRKNCFSIIRYIL